jgi:hypothetical protein
MVLYRQDGVRALAGALPVRGFQVLRTLSQLVRMARTSLRHYCNLTTGSKLEDVHYDV